jgi:hypothetical protein
MSERFEVRVHRTPTGYCIRLLHWWAGASKRSYGHVIRRRYVHSIFDANRIEKRWNNDLRRMP